MSDREEFLAACLSAYGPEDASRARDALDWMAARLEGRLRASGEAAWKHDLRVATILLEMGMDAESVLAGALHDAFEIGTREETASEGEQEGLEPKGSKGAAPASRPAAVQLRAQEQARHAALRADLATHFGEGVALLVEDVSRLAALKARNKTVQAAETIRKMLFAMARDIRVILVKLADKLDSMRTLKYLDEERQKEIAAECLDVFAPLADRLGISWMKDELEDLALKSLNREAFDQIKDIVSAKKGEREAYLARVEGEIRNAAADEGVVVEVTARAKHFYSIYQKMRKRAKGAEELFDLLGLRLICEAENDCYALLGMVHRLWKPIDGRFKDYIAMPKANGYRSLHTTVMCYEGRLLEVQIRTAEMHRVAEHGVASHWLYKKGRTAETPKPEDMPIVNRLKEWGDFLSQGAEYLEEIKRELLKDSIFVFTPRGDVVQLPSGSTPLDFAYAIHSDIGNRCVGAKADGQIVSLDAELQNTQVVEIQTSASARPNMNWLRIARTSKARSKIRAALIASGQVLAIDRNIVAGRKAAQAQAAPAAKAPGHEAEEAKIQGTAPLWRREPEAGQGSVDYRAYEPGEALRNERAGVAIGGAKNMMIRIAGCCRPVTGDPIVGYVSRGRGIIVHRADCRSVHAIADFAERRIDVRWEEGAGVVTARFRINAKKTADLFSEIESAVRKFGGRLREGHLGERGDGTVTGYFTMEVESRDDVKKVAKAVRGVPAVLGLEEDD
jgi:guanosine-3',5'-bis(diphosphate) 3'-pyrophosphohydrolase